VRHPQRQRARTSAAAAWISLLGLCCAAAALSKPGRVQERTGIRREPVSHRTPSTIGETPGKPASELARLKAGYRRPGSIPFPADNRYTPERERLGRTLFFDPRLSRSGWIACATCHNPGFSWGDALPRAIGHGMKTLDRRTPTILNLAWAEAAFWDGRAATLEEQALGPIEAPGEMSMPLGEMLSRIRAIPGYRHLFTVAYPDEGITKETVAKAIATFERTVVSAEAPFDRWVRGKEDAISDAARRGFVLFNTKARCNTCHSDWRFTDDSFHDIGLPTRDRGRGEILEGIEVMEHAFKTPTLRNVDHRGPYMHDGSLATLEEVIDLYDRGGQVKRPSLSREIRPLHLTAREKADLVAFLKTLTSADPPPFVPTLPR